MAAISGRAGARKVAVIGAGVIGLSIAWRLAQRNINVTVFESDEPGRGASRAAAGMLSAVAETASSETHFFELCRASRRLWPGFAHELSVAGGRDLDLREQGTLLVALSAAEEAEHDALAEAHRADGTVRRISSGDCRALEPDLTADIRAAYFAPEDGQVDNRATVEALAHALQPLGVQILTRTPVLRLIARGGSIVGVESSSGSYEFDLIVLAAGVETDALARASGLESVVPRISPVRGQTIALAMDPHAPLLKHVVRGATHYLVPRSSGHLIIGATSEPGSFDLTIDPKATEFLIEGAKRLVPRIAALPFVEAWTGLRPFAKSGMPVIGPAMPGLWLALGHYRNGVLLAPLTAELVAGAVIGSALPVPDALAARFAPHAEH
ncbi:MAG: glycine oxidase ThiO [Alphaproteobacteria bacterium]